MSQPRDFFPNDKAPVSACRLTGASWEFRKHTDSINESNSYRSNSSVNLPPYRYLSPCGDTPSNMFKRNEAEKIHYRNRQPAGTAPILWQHLRLL
jgi:hypothetical protein